VIVPFVVIGGRLAQVTSIGEAAGFAGMNRITVRVPAGITPGNAVPVRLIYIDRPSNEVTIAVH
jgi:uncharacterized protein (TIGR03437 family)